MIYAMDIEPEIQPNIYGYDSHLHDILFSYFIKQDSDFLKSWKKEMQETNSWIDMQWFDDISKQIHLLLEQMEENQKADLITLLIRTSEYKFTNKLLFSVSDEYAIQIYLPPASEVPYNRQPPIVRRILLLRQQLETRMEVCIEELYEQLYLEVVLEQERLMREI